MDMKSRARTQWPLIALGIFVSLAAQRAAGQTAPVPPQAAPTRVTLDQAIDMALKHNHSLQAARTMILQNQA
jgi:outer membrane protein TolC